MREPEIYSVGELTRMIKAVVEDTFPMVAVRGELSNVKRAGSGHVYLTLKDDDAQISGVMWKSIASRTRFELQDGLEVIALGSLDVYPPRGSYQLKIEEMVPQGLGPLELAFRQLQEKLQAEGLFDPEHKKPLPRFPRRIALVTSPTGAAVRDMLQVLTRRWPIADVIVVPVAVQGTHAAGQIATAIDNLPFIPDLDVVICGRGGGSLEDLWSFNEEVVARAIHACPIPIVSAVGHEIDVTIADLVADRRALTPTEGAELIAPDRNELARGLQQLMDSSSRAISDRLKNAKSALASLADRRVFREPFAPIHQRIQQVDDLSDRLQRGFRAQMNLAGQKVASLAAELDALSPLKTLSRGFSITRNPQSMSVLGSVTDVQSDDIIETLLPDGRVASRVTNVETTPPLSLPDRLTSAESTSLTEE